MTDTDHQNAALLLTSWFARSGTADAKPLSPTEWQRLTGFLEAQGRTPADLIRDDPAQVLAGWSDAAVPMARVQALLGRSVALGLSLEHWSRAGIRVITRADADYPPALVRRLGAHAPPLLFVCGNRALLATTGIAVVGSRDATPEDLDLAASLGREAARLGRPLVSGGARGVDQAAMQGALAAEGQAVGVLCEGLLRAVTAREYRPKLRSGDLVLLSLTHPEARFEVGNAMARNKIIYCLSEVAVVAATTRDKGGTWAGATECLRHGWVPVLVNRSSAPGSGAAALVDKGARWLPPLPLELPETPAPEESGPPPEAPAPERTDAHYALFLEKLRELTATQARSAKEIAAAIGVREIQVKDWLGVAVAEGRASKVGRTARYRWRAAMAQGALFE
jgi:predicted Rossmann fold nucleotide-binding protein DprA/Smf involved in DNA uptake